MKRSTWSSSKISPGLDGNTRRWVCTSNTTLRKRVVRFISVAENIDSKNGIDNLVLPFTNVINSFYARQASTKTKAAHRARVKSGMFIGSRAPFGYQKDPNDRHHLIVDPPAADVVRDIFQMFADGIGYVRMTKYCGSGAS